MALIRCPKHDIPYNSANPRGCPACAREEGGEDQATMMAELARASRRVDAIADIQLPEPDPDPGLVLPEPTGGIATLAKKRPALLIGVSALIGLVFILTRLMGPRLVELPDPATNAGEIRPLSVFPGQDVTVLFAQLGTQPPEPHPSVRAIQRYTYGEDLIFDAFNGTIHALEIRVPNRIWQGLRVGVSQQEAEGAVALLGPVARNEPTAAIPQELGPYLVFPSLDGRPRRILSTQVRPPNGCYDVTVEIRPRAIGTVPDGGLVYAAVGRKGDALSWVITSIRAVEPSVRDSLSGPAPC